MLTMLTVVVIALAFGLIVLGVIVVGIRQEPPWTELSEAAPSRIAALARRLLGLHVRKATPTAASADRQVEDVPGTLATRPRATT